MEGQGTRILIVDDDEMTQTILRKLLEVDGHSTDVCSSGPEALSRLAHDSYDVVLCDMWMAGMNGKEFYLQLKQSFPEYQRKLILITGDLASETTWEFIEERHLPYLIKPLSKSLLHRRIQEIIGDGLAQQPAQKWDGVDRRLHRRVAIKVTARVRRKKWDVAGPDTVSVANYSRGGIFFLTDHEYRVGMEVLVACPYSGFNDVEQEGYVMRVVDMEGRRGVAIAIGENAAIARAALEKASKGAPGPAPSAARRAATGLASDDSAETCEGDVRRRLSEENAELKRLHDRFLDERDGLSSQEAELRRQLEETAAARAATTQQLCELQKEIEVRNEQLEEVEEIRHRATYDALTGLLNRAAIMEALQEELIRAGREGGGVGVLLGDLDHFKHINDTYGHLAGDAVLREAARRITTAVRPYDSVGRYGGEEFLIVLAGCKNKEDLLTKADRICAGVRAAPVATDEGEIAVTLSLGAASGTEYPEVEAVLRAADAALYRAKRSGRNRIELALTATA